MRGFRVMDSADTYLLTMISECIARTGKPSSG